MIGDREVDKTKKSRPKVGDFFVCVNATYGNNHNTQASRPTCSISNFLILPSTGKCDVAFLVSIDQ